MKLEINDILQWTGTICFMAMYVLMAMNLYPWNIVAGFAGGAMYMMWSLRVANKPQIITNFVGISVCMAGLYKAFFG